MLLEAMATNCGHIRGDKTTSGPMQRVMQLVSLSGKLYGCDIIQ